jgi:hypothetical protein
MSSERNTPLLKSLNHFKTYTLPFRVMFQHSPPRFAHTSTKRK